MKPPLGQACNGCGVCCAAEACPVALIFLWQRRGPCRALEWHEAGQHYRCGMVLQPALYVRTLRALPLPLHAWLGRRVRRWIAAGSACDSSAHVELG